MRYDEITTGDQLRQFRESHNMTYSDLSDFTGYSISGLYRAEKSDHFKDGLTQSLIHYQKIKNYREKIDQLELKVQNLEAQSKIRYSEGFAALWDHLTDYDNVFHSQLIMLGTALTNLLDIDDIESLDDRKEYLDDLGDKLNRLYEDYLDGKN